MSKLARPAYIDYQTALDGFTKLRKEMNDLLEKKDYETAKTFFNGLKMYAADDESVAMDLLAYYYKTGLKNVVEENYMRYIEWEFLAAAKGNELAIEKLQFLIGYACDAIMENEVYDLIEYKNDIDEYNALYVIGKNLCKVVVREFMKVYPIDLVQKEDDRKPYTKEAFIAIRKMIDDAIPKTIAIMRS